jgi:hypothetical protein
MKNKFRSERDHAKVKAKRFLKTIKSISTMFDDWTKVDATDLYLDSRQSRNN